jgi:hypothetical protein
LCGEFDEAREPGGETYAAYEVSGGAATLTNLAFRRSETAKRNSVASNHQPDIAALLAFIAKCPSVKCRNEARALNRSVGPIDM